MHTEENIQPVIELPDWLKFNAQLVPGLLLTAGIATAAIVASQWQWLAEHGFSALTLAILLGALVGNTLVRTEGSVWAAGIGYAKQYLLRLGIILYGFKLTFQHLGLVGIGGLVADLFIVGATFLVTCWLGTKLFRLPYKTTMLIGIGHSICGAAAIMAAQPVVKGKTADVTIAVATIVVFGTLAIFVYPMLYQLNLQYEILPTTDSAFGLFIGSTVHEVAQVVAAGDAINADVADTAVIAKMGRVMMLAPFLVLLGFYLRGGEGEQKTAITIPWFAVVFVVVVVINSLIDLPPLTLEFIAQVDTAALAMAMAALGLTTDAGVLRRAGIKPLLLGVVLFAWLIGAGVAINYAVELLA